MTNSKGPLGGGIPPFLINMVLAIFVTGWIGSLVAEIFRSGYQAPTGLNETMIALVTAFFVAQQRLSQKEEPTDKDKDDDDDTTAAASGGTDDGGE